MDNQQIVRDYIRKADLTVASMTSNGGVLVTDQAQQFFQIAIKEQRLLQDVAFKPLKAPTAEIPTMGFLSRIARRGQEGVALTSADRAAPTTGKVNLSTVEIKCQVNLSYQDVEDNVEGERLPDTIKKMMGEAFGRDLEDLIINGNTASSDPLLSLLNGVVTQATSNIVDDGVVVLAQSHFLHAINALPDQFQKNKAQMRFYLAPTYETKWRDIVSGRVTVLGDNAIVSAAPIPAYGVQVIPVPLFPVGIGTGSNESVGLYLDPKNILVGVWRDVMLKSQEDIQVGQWINVARMRADVKYQYEPAVAKITKIKLA